MPATLALVNLYTKVGEKLVALGHDAASLPMHFGWRPVAQSILTDRRIVWTPGDPTGVIGDFIFGKVSRSVTQNPKPIGELAELVTVTLSACDPSEPENEQKQYIAARELLDLWAACVDEVGRTTVTVEDTRWLTDKKERSHGAAIVVVLSVASVIPSTKTHAVAPVGARAVLTVEELDHEETFETSPAPLTARAAALSVVALSGEQTIDGIALEEGDAVLVTAQEDGEDNGLYVVSSGAWARHTGADADAEVTSGFFVRVLEGVVNAETGFVLSTPNPIVVGTTPLTFERTTPVPA
jgi:hypothetical protein